MRSDRPNAVILKALFPPFQLVSSSIIMRRHRHNYSLRVLCPSVSFLGPVGHPLTDPHTCPLGQVYASLSPRYAQRHGSVRFLAQYRSACS